MLAIVLTPRANADLGESLGRRREELVEGLRSFPVGRDVIFDLQDQDCLRIVRVLHGARDVEAVFADPDKEPQP